MHPAELYKKEVLTIPESADAGEAAESMAKHSVGCLIVVDAEDRAVGVLTDRDLALRVVAHGLPGSETHVATVMTSPVVSVAPDDSLDDAVERMRSLGIRRVPIVEDGKPVGIVALDDALQEVTRELGELGLEAVSKFRHAGSEAGVERLRRELSERIDELRMGIRRSGWYARETFLDELDEIREKIRRAVTP